MKIRQGSTKVKPKIQKDFKKKTAKVGKKVARGNVTEIKIQSKRINIPLQSAITAKAPADEREMLEKLLKQMHHYSAPSRVAALDETKGLVNSSPHAEAYISLLFPKALELLFDDDSAARRALMALLALLLSKYESSAFTSVISVAITYICSGLTSLNRGVIRDSLALLQLLADLHSALLTPYMERLVVHILSLLSATGHVQTKISSGVLTIGKASVAQNNSNSSSSSSSSSSGGGGGGGGSNSGGSGGGGAAGGGGGPDGGVATSRSDKDAFSCLRVISTLLSCAVQSTTIHGTERASEETQSHIIDHAKTSAVIVLRARFRKCRWLEASQQQTFHTYSAKGQMSHATEDREWLSESLLIDLCARLKTLWTSLVLEESKLSADAVPVLREVGRIAYNLGLAGEGRLLEFRGLVSCMFQAFPHKSTEAQVANAGSSIELSLNKSVYALDVTLCNVALLFLSDASVSQDAGVQSAVSKAKAYILICLARHIEEIEGGSVLASVEEVDVHEAVEDDEEEENSDQGEYDYDYGDDDDDDDDDDEGEEEGNDEEEEDKENDDEMMAVDAPKARKGKSFAKSGTTASSDNNVEIATRMYSSLQNMALAGESDHVVEVLLMMHRLIQSSTTATTNNSRQTLLKIIRPGILCLCSIATNPVLWTRGYDPSALDSLVSSLVMSFSLMVRWPKEPGGEMTSALLQATLTILRKMPLDERGKGQAASLCECIQSLFTTAISYNSENATSGDVKSTCKAATFYTLCQSQQRITLLDLYFYAPFANLLEVTRTIALSLAAINHKLSLEEQGQNAGEMRYFLRLLYERRSEFNLPEFFDVLFASMRVSVNSRCKGMSSSGASISASMSKKIPRALAVAGRVRWAAHDVADLLLWCSSAEAPFRILSFLAPAIENLASSVSGLVKERTSEQLSERWLAEYVTANAAIAVIMTLLRPCLVFHSEVDEVISARAIDEGDNKSAGGSSLKHKLDEDRAPVKRICDLLGKVVVSLCAAFGQAVAFEAEQNDCASFQSHDVQRRLYETGALCLSTVTPSLLSQQGSSCSPSFLVFECFLEQFQASWTHDAATLSTRVFLFKGLKFLLSYTCLAGPRAAAVTRAKLMETLTLMTNEASCEYDVRQMVKEI